jgi:hypothetical protein
MLVLIDVYRRRLAGRGPFRNVRCTFAHLESCSAYGERMAREAPSTWRALCRICGRLRRCRDLSLYQFPNGEIAGGRGYDTLLQADQASAAVGQLDKVLRRVHESPAVRSAVLDAASMVLAHSQSNSALALPHGELVIRPAAAVRRSLARRFYARGAMTMFFAGVAAATALAGVGIPFIAPVLLAATMTAVSAWASHRLTARIDRLEVLSAIEGPLTLHQPTRELPLATPALPNANYR